MKWEFRINRFVNVDKFSEEFKSLLGKYFNSVMKLARIQLFKTEIKKITTWSIPQILNAMISNLIFNKNGNKLIVMIDSNIKTDDGISILSLVKLINYGNLDIKGCNIINEAFDYVITMLTYTGGVL